MRIQLFCVALGKKIRKICLSLRAKKTSARPKYIKSKELSSIRRTIRKRKLPNRKTSYLTRRLIKISKTIYSCKKWINQLSKSTIFWPLRLQESELCQQSPKKSFLIKTRAKTYHLRDRKRIIIKNLVCNLLFQPEIACRAKASSKPAVKPRKNHASSHSKNKSKLKKHSQTNNAINLIRRNILL